MTASGSFIIKTAFCERDKTINLTILRLYPAKLAGIFFLMGSRFLLSGYCATKNAD